MELKPVQESPVLWWTLAVLIWLPTWEASGSQPRIRATVDDDRLIKVVLLTGSDADNPFWNLLTGYMKAVADDLYIKVEVIFADGDRYNMIQLVREVCLREIKPDAIMLHSFKRTGQEVLTIADRNEVPIFLVNSGLTEQEVQSTGGPREKLAHWIGQLIPDDHDAGKRLAIALFEEARTRKQMFAPDGKIHVIGLNGIRSHSASIERERGLLEAIAENDDVVLDQIVAADWERNLARKRCQILLRRYPDVSIIWSCSDHMAVGAIAAAESEGLMPGKDVLIGGVDATPHGLQLIEQGTMFASIGGHFQEGGWGVAMLYDYFHGTDFAKFGTSFDSRMILVTRQNIDRYRSRVTPVTWQQSDFTKFSLHENPDMEKYPFDAHARPEQETNTKSVSP